MEVGDWNSVSNYSWSLSVNSKDEEEKEMGLIKKVQLEESCARDHKPE